MLKAPTFYVIVDPIYEEKIGSIIIPITNETRKRHSEFYGIVKSVGPDCTLEIKEGDKICFRRNEGFKINHGKKEYLAINSNKWIEGVYVETT